MCILALVSMVFPQDMIAEKFRIQCVIRSLNNRGQTSIKPYSNDNRSLKESLHCTIIIFLGVLK